MTNAAISTATAFCSIDVRFGMMCNTNRGCTEDGANMGAIDEF
jgi:hypothetical protein